MIMKLNNKGWGLVTFLIFLGMFFLTLLLLAFLINRYNDKFGKTFINDYSYSIEKIDK